VGSNRIILSASPAYLARQPLAVTPATLGEHEWLMYKHPALSRHYWTFRQAEQVMRIEQPVPRILSDNYDFLLANALAGAGLLITPWWSAAPYLADGRLVRLMSDCELDPDAFGAHILAVYPSHRRATHKVQVFIQFLEAPGNAVMPDRQ
jgi:DNA-binding transcriptional LysR family regulator